MADNGVGPTGGTGTLFGSKDLQHSLDTLAGQITTLNTLLQKAQGSVNSSSSSVAGGASPGSGAPTTGSAGPIATKWNQLSNWVQGQAGGKGNGGNSSFSGVPTNFGSSGGGGGGTGGMMGSLMKAGNAAMSGWNIAANYGASQIPGQTSMDTYASWSAMHMVGGSNAANRSQVLGQAFGSNGSGMNSIGLSPNDIMQGNMLRQYVAGSPNVVGSARGGSAWSGMNQLGISNPTLGSAGSASVLQDMYQPGNFYRARMAGLPSALLPGGALATPNQYLGQMMSRTFQGRSTVSSDVMNAAVGMGGALNHNLQMAGLSQSSISALSDLAVARNNALSGNGGQKPLTDNQFSSLLDQAGSGSRKGMQSAQDQLKKYGLNYSTLQGFKDAQAPVNARNADVNGDFASNVAGATKELAQFQGVLASIMNYGPIKKIVGLTGGAAVTNSQVQGGMGLLGQGSPMGMLGQPGGSSFPSSDGANSNKNSNSSGHIGKSPSSTPAGVTAAMVISSAESQIGTPYHLGMETPHKGFDCGSLLQWAYGQNGIRIERYVPSLWAQTKKNQVNVKDTQPGDLLFRADNGHVTMRIGGNKIIEAPHTGAFVRERAFNASEWDHASRVVGSVGLLGSSPSDAGNTSQAMSQQGNSGSPGVGSGASGAFGSTEEIDAVMAGLSNFGGGSPLGASSSASSTAQGSGSNTSNGGSSPNTGKAPTSVAGNVALGKKMAAAVGWTGGEWDALYQLWQHESEWRTTVKNYQGSGAYGIPQSLPASKMASAGPDYMTNPATQIKWGLNYIKQRYGDPATAWKDWQARKPHWYDKGAWQIKQDETAVVHKDEMIIPSMQAETIRQALTTDAYFKKDTPGSSRGSSSSSGGVTLQFNSGSIVIQMQGQVTDVAAKSAAKSFVDELAKKNIYDKIAAGVTNG